MKKILLVVGLVVLFFNHSILANTYVVCTNNKFSTEIRTLKIDDKEIYISIMAEEFKNYTPYIKELTKERIHIERLRERNHKEFKCDQVDNLFLFQYPDCKSKDASIVSKFENEVTSLYKIHPYRDELYIKIDRISGFMTLEHAWTNSVPKKNSFGFSFETNTSYNTYTCKPKTKTSF